MATFSISEMEKYLTEHFKGKTTIDFPMWFFKDIPRKLCDGMREALMRGDKVRLECVGVIEPKIKKARQGRNPKSGLMVEIPEKKGVKFKLSEEMKLRLNGKAEKPDGRKKSNKTQGIQ